MNNVTLPAEWIKSFGWFFIIYFVCYSFEITNFNISIDDEFYTYSDSCSFADVGRWVHPLIRILLWPQVVIPLGPYIVFGLFFCLSFLYVLRIYGVERLGAFEYASFGAYVLFPVWSSQLEFSVNVLPVGLGLLSICVSAYIVVNSEGGSLGFKARHVIAAVFVAIAIGCYQSLSLVYPVIVVGAFLRRYILFGEDVGRYISSIMMSTLVFVIGFAVYLFAAKALIAACDVAVSSYGTKLVNPELLVKHPVSVIGSVIRDLYGVYFSFWRGFGWTAYAILSVIGCGIYACLFASRISMVRLAVTSASLLTILLLPAGFTLLNGSGLPLRVFLAAPVAILVMALLFYQVAKNRAVKAVGFVLIFWLCFNELYVQSSYQARAWVAQKHDMLLASSLNDAITKLVSELPDGEIRVDFKGTRAPRSVYPEVFSTAGGASFFEWDGGNSDRMVRYMNVIGFYRYVSLRSSERDKYLGIYGVMPVWPRPGSIRLEDGVVLVKLSD